MKKKQNEDKVPDIEKDGWSAEKIAEEAANKEAEEIVRQMDEENDSELITDSRDAESNANSDEEEE